MISQAVLVASVLSLIFGILSAIHWFWAFGGRWGFDGVVPTVDGAPAFSPGPGATIAVACALLAAGYVCLWRAGVFTLPLPAWVPVFGVWTLAVLFLARAVGDFRLVGFFKTIRDSQFARNDTRIYSPLCAVISILAVWLGVVAR